MFRAGGSPATWTAAARWWCSRTASATAGPRPGLVVQPCAVLHAGGSEVVMPESAFLPEPFTVQPCPEALADLRARLRATRWPDAPEDAGWSLGTDLAYLRDLVAYWADGFDWEAQEKALSEFPRFRARLDGLGIHYVHARAVNPAGPVLPLVLCHGWPDSFWRYTKVIPLLTDPGAHGGDPRRRVRRGRARHAGLRVLRPPGRAAA